MNKIICDSEGSTEQWHLQRERGGGPLCRARLFGRIRTTKGRTNCRSCEQLDRPGIFAARHHAATRALAAVLKGCQTPAKETITKAVLSSGYERGLHGALHHVVCATQEALLDADYAYVDRDRLALTARGRAVAEDLVRPARLHGKDRLVHARNALSDLTACGHRALPSKYMTNELRDLLRLDKGRRDLTCLWCVARWRGPGPWRG